jgi:hypothetical protein
VHADAVKPTVTIAIIPVPFLGIGKHFVGFRGLLEAIFRPVILVAVGVILEGQLTIRALDVVGAGAALDSEHFVIITLIRHGVPVR